MTKIELDLSDNVISTIKKVKETNDVDIEVVIPEGSVILENSINIKLLNKQAEKYGKNLRIVTLDEAGQNLLSMLNDEEGMDRYSKVAPENQERMQERRKTLKRKLPKPDLDFINAIKLPRFSVPQMSLGKSKVAVGAGFLIITAIILSLVYFSRAVKAEVKIIVHSQPLARSIQIRVDKNGLTKAPEKTLRGTAISATESGTLSTPTTGEKLEGKRAKGKAKIFNFLTDTEKEFSKGDILTVKIKDKDYNYTLDDDVTVAAGVLDTTTTPPGIIASEAEVNIVAADIGTVYNIESSIDLEVKGYKKTQFYAKTSTDIIGGESKIIKTVTQADRDKLSKELTKTVIETAQKALEGKSTNSIKVIQGTSSAGETQEVFNHNLNDEADTLELMTSVTINALAYNTNDLDKLVEEMLKDFVPENFVLSSKEKEVNVEVLGNSETTVLNSDKADLQITIKTFVVPDITEDSIKEMIKGKSSKEAEEILGGVKNIRTYSINLDSVIPIFKSIPTNTDNINIIIERE